MEQIRRIMRPTDVPDTGKHDLAIKRFIALLYDYIMRFVKINS